MTNPTANLSMTKPTVGGSTDSWGTTLNENVVDIIDALFSISGTDVTMSDIKFNSVGLQETGSGTDTVKIQAPSAVTQYTLTMPGAVGSTNQVLSASDGSGTLAWTSPEVGDITSVADATNGGMTVTNGTGPDVTLGLNFNDLSAVAVNVATDSIAILDADDSGTKKESIADLATAMGGTGLTGASGTLAVDASQTQITAVGTIATGVWQGTAIANGYLANSTVSYGGISLALGASDATPAFNLSDATAYTGDSSLVTVGTVASGTWNGSTVAVAYGGTGATTLTDGGVLLGSGTGAITATAVLGNGEILIGDASGDPVALDVGSSTAITILGTVATGVWNGTTVAVGYGGTGLASYAAGDILYASGSTTLAKLAKGSDTEVLTLASGVPTWAAPTVGDITGVTAGTGLSGGGTSGTVTLNVEAAQTQITSVGTLTSLGVGNITSTGASTTIFYAVNDGNPEFKFGSSSAECLRIQPVYDSGAQTLNYVIFDTAAASGTANKGEIRFTVDGDASGTSTVKFQDAGVDIAGTLAVTGTSTLAGDVIIAGTTPTLTIGDAGTEDTKIVFDGNTQDYYVGLDDTDDAFKIGLGSAVGTTPAMMINSSSQFAFNNDNHTSDFSFNGSDDAITMNIGSPLAATNDWSGLALGSITSPKGAVFYKRTATYNRGNVVICLNSEANTNNVSLADEDDVVAIFAYDKNTSLLGDCAVTGELTAGTKTFRIDHPLADKKDTHQLVHSCIEGPKADLIYRGTVDLSGGSAQVDLDEAVGMSEGTFEVLCRDVQCWIQNDSGWSGVRGSVSGNLLTIECKDSVSDDTVSWMVVAERCDPHIMEAKSTDEDGRVIVEPEKESPLEPDGD